MAKAVREVEVKIFTSYTDALSNSNYILEVIDVEGGSLPDQIQSKKLSANCLLKNFTRRLDSNTFIEKVYLKIEPASIEKS